MKQRKKSVGMLVAAGLLVAIAGDAHAFGRRGYGYSAPLTSGPVYAWSSPYVMPMPYYGILPPPLGMYNIYGGSNDPVARKRPAPFPAIPLEPSQRLEDRRRVRYEITVPFANAVVSIDGVKTKQTGVSRVFVTPPLTEDKQYTATIVVQWVDQTGETRTRQRVFTVVAGETVRHTFID